MAVDPARKTGEVAPEWALSTPWQRLDMGRENFPDRSGAAIAETASIGSVMIPAMRKSGCDAPFAAAVATAASTVDPQRRRRGCHGIREDL
jgi:hypothetical protein